MSTRIPVSGAGFRPYEVLVGRSLLGSLGEGVSGLARGRTAVVTDETVASLYGPAVLAALETAGLRARLLTVPPGEGSKSFAELERVLDRLAACGLDRTDLVIALGGGVVGDLAGLAAALYMRGIDFVQVPTTLLAQVDSSVGGKTGINHEKGKNTIGAIHQPTLVLADVDTLGTLPRRQLAAGMAEVIKHGVIRDGALFARLEALGGLAALERETLAEIVARNCQIKAAVVAADERESRLRMILNFGHTFAHALEAASGYARYLHGEAVAIGMVMAAELSERLGRWTHAESERLRALLGRYELPTAVAEDDPADAELWLRYMSGDKKARAGKMRFIVGTSIGSVTVLDDVPLEAVRAALASGRSR